MDLALAGVNRYPTLIVGNSQQDRLIIENTVFVDNDMNTNNSEVRRPRGGCGVLATCTTLPARR
jgi:hypothetical protein